MVATATSTQAKWDPRKPVAPIKTYSKLNPTEITIDNKASIVTRKEAI